MQLNEFAQVDQSQRIGSYARPSPGPATRTATRPAIRTAIRTAAHTAIRKRRAWRKYWASLLAASLVAPLGTLVGCGTLGGLPGSGSLRPSTPAALAAPIPDLPSPQASISNSPQASIGNSPYNQQPGISRVATTPFTHNTTADAAALMAPVVAAAYHAPRAGIAGGGLAAHRNDYGPASNQARLTSGESEYVGGDCNACATASSGDDSANGYRNAQEYIFDGGDQQPTVIIKKDWTTAGVDPSDTVIYYETLAGSVCVQPTNRVPIYAPRFGAVRQVSGLQLATRATGTERILAPVSVERFDEKNLAGTMVQPVAPQGEQQVGLIDAFQESYVTPPMEQVLPLYRMSAARVPFELMDPTRTGLITIQELVDVQEFIQNAQTWVNPESLEVEISNQTAILLKDTKAAQDLFVYDLPDGCSMRIFKAASHTIANSGDTVSFTIRFDNAGVKPLGNAVIIDSLSPRLKYIQGSQQCSVGVRFSAEPNEVGSMSLRWEIEEPIEATQGGVISFDCRVR